MPVGKICTCSLIHYIFQHPPLPPRLQWLVSVPKSPNKRQGTPWTEQDKSNEYIFLPMQKYVLLRQISLTNEKARLHWTNSSHSFSGSKSLHQKCEFCTKSKTQTLPSQKHCSQPFQLFVITYSEPVSPPLTLRAFLLLYNYFQTSSALPRSSSVQSLPQPLNSVSFTHVWKLCRPAFSSRWWFTILICSSISWLTLV